MPINDQYKVVFVHIPKNGGTTVEYLLGMHGDLDQVGIIPYENQVKNEFLFGAGCQEFTANELKNVIGLDKFNDYTKFCICRNPYARVVSYIAWVKQYRPHATKDNLSQAEFDNEILDLYESFKNNGHKELYLKPQWIYACDENKSLIVDRIFRFEEYPKVLSFIDELIDEPVNKEERRMISNHGSYTDYLTPQTIDIINHIYADDFTIFNYPVIR